MIADASIDAGPFIGVISQIIMWVGLLTALGVLKGFIVQGLSLAMAEFLIRAPSEEVLEKVCRWLVRGDQVKDYLKQIKDRS